MIINWNLKLIAISILTCSVLAMSTDLQSVCAPSSTQSSIEEATRVEHLIMGMFVSSALFEFSELSMTLPSFGSAEETRAAVIIVTIYHSIRLRSTERTITTLASNLSWGSMLYALSLFGTSFGYLFHLSSVSSNCALSDFCRKHHFFFFTSAYFQCMSLLLGVNCRSRSRMDRAAS